MKVCSYSRIVAAPASRLAYSACRSPILLEDSHHPFSPASRAIVMTWVHRSPSTPSASRIFMTSAWSTTCPFSSREMSARDSPIRLRELLGGQPRRRPQRPHLRPQPQPPHIRAYHPQPSDERSSAPYETWTFTIPEPAPAV